MSKCLHVLLSMAPLVGCAVEPPCADVDVSAWLCAGNLSQESVVVDWHLQLSFDVFLYEPITLEPKEKYVDDDGWLCANRDDLADDLVELWGPSPYKENCVAF
jgi:hypothetical protein